MMSRVLALGAMALSASGTKLYLYNSTDTHGFGFKAYAAEVDYSNGAFSTTQLLANDFTNTDMISVSGAAACGDYYIAIQTNAPVGAGLAVAGLVENGTTLQYDTDVLFHALACSPSNPTEVYAVINNPFSVNSSEHITFRAITYDFVKQTIVKELGSHTLSTKDPLFIDSGFTFSADRSQLWMINDKSIVTIDLSARVTAVQSFQASLGEWYPYQIEADSIKGGSATGLAYKAKNDGPVTEFAYGTFELKGSDASFKLSGKVGDVSQVWNGGLPWAFCSSQRLAFVVNTPPRGTAAAILSVFSLPEMGVVAEKALSLADSTQNRVIAALAAKC